MNYHSCDPVALNQRPTDSTPSQSHGHLPFRQSMNSNDTPSSANASISSWVGRYSKDSWPSRWSRASARVRGNSSVNSLDRLFISFIWLVVDIKIGRPTDAIVSIAVCLVLMRFKIALVLDRWGLGGGVREYCACSELHPRSGFGMLTGRIPNPNFRARGTILLRLLNERPHPF